MKREAIITLCVLICLPVVVPSAQASVVTIDPDTGWSGYFHWTNGPGPLDGIQTSAYMVDIYGHHIDPWTTGLGDWAWSITLPADGVIMSIKTEDPYSPPGDKWVLYVDGLPVSWTNSYTTGGSYFHGDYSNLALSAGTHIITLNVTTVAGPYVRDGAGLRIFLPDDTCGCTGPRRSLARCDRHQLGGLAGQT